MKPTFALDLTRDAIALLHRTPKGWLSIGEVAFDAPDMDEALDYLRKTALGLSPLGVATKIVLPNSQILYTDVHAPGPSREDKRRQIAAALEGRTPYAVEDLVFDWSGKGQTVKVAVVARETLQEAEGFAVTHRLNPVSFVAIPEEGAFVGEPWFGPTAAAEALLAPGEAVDRDREPVTILQRELPAAAPAVADTPAADTPATDAPDTDTPDAGEPEPAPAPVPVAPAPAPAAPALAEDDPLPGLEEALNADLPPAADPVPDPAPAPAPADAADAPDLPPVPEDPAPGAMEPAALTPERAAEEAAAEVFADRFARTPEPEVEEAPFAHVTDPAAFPDGEDDLPPPARPAPAPATLADQADDIPPAPPSAAMVAFASRRSAAAAGTAKPVEGVTRADPATPPGATARLTPPPARPAPAKGFAGLVTAPSIPGTRAKPKGKLSGPDVTRPTPAGPTTVKSPARPGGTFGTAAPPRNRGGVVFMVLVALLLLFLAAIAAWSSYYLARSDETGTGVTLADDQAVPGVDDEMLADLQDPEGMTDPLPEAEGAAAGGLAADLATESAPINLALEPDPEAGAEAEALAGAAEPPPAPTTDTAALAEAAPEAVPEPTAAPAAEPAPEPAPGTTVTTELAAAQPPVEDQDEIFLSAMDAPPPALDALALPAPDTTRDAAPDSPMPPPAFGTVYRFGPDGLLVPTPEGILSPDGVMLIAGPPPLVPPSRSPAAAALAAAAAPEAAPPATNPPATDPTATDPLATPGAGASLLAPDPGDPALAPAPADPAMAGFRPRPRPEGLVPAAPEDDASLAVPDASDFAGLRPLPRPASVLAAASASRPATPADLGAQGASLTAQAEAELAAAAAFEAANPSVVAISKRPAARPSDLSNAVEAAVAAAVREPAPEPEVEVASAPAPELKPEELEEVDEPETASAAPSIPTKASVAKQATFVNAINLSKINLIGTYGTDSKRTALVRQANGRYKKVKVGDKIDGGTIKAITDTEVRYQKGGKLLSLKLPKA